RLLVPSREQAAGKPRRRLDRACAAAGNPGVKGRQSEALTWAPASGAWAVGSYASGSGYQTLTLHWNGTIWQKVPSSNAGSGKNVLLTVAATSATNAWAVGTAGGTTGGTLVEHWEGKTWTGVPSPGSNGNFLSGVAATSASNAWAVGTS